MRCSLCPARAGYPGRMRWMLAAATSVLVAGCSGGQHAETTRTPLSVPAKTSATATSTTGPGTTSTSLSAPAVGTDMSTVIGWIEAGEPVSAQDFGTVTRDGVRTAVDGVAFTTETVNCTSTASYAAGALACLVDLDEPPPRPPNAVSVWKGNWVDFGGATVEIGSVRGDPGPFRDGEGAPLTAGDTLSFGDFRCRAERADVLCVNYAQRAAVRLGAAGVDGFGCLTEVPAPPGVGIRLSC